MFAYIRTNEMFRGWPKNAAGLRYFQDRLANELSASVGELTITSGSAHIYDIDFSTINSYLSYNRQTNRITFDNKGDWRIYKEDNTYIAEHYFSGKLIEKISSSNKDKLLQKMYIFISDIRHAVWIGRQIEKI